jgi:aspartate/methionine/tyrosine aminotransferase
VKRALDGVIAALGRYPGATIDLLVGEPCFGPPAEILARFGRTADIAVGGYGPPAGLDGLRRILAERVGGAGSQAKNTVVTHGAKGGLLALFAALIEPGDRVIHALPCYPAYPAMIRRFGGKPVGVAETAAGFTGWSAAVVDALGPKVRAVVLSSPSNPTGSVVSAEDLAALAGICCEGGIRLILDEAYAEFRFSDEPDPAGLFRSDDTLVRVGSASKGLALPGWRIGWIISDPGLAARLAEVQGALLNPPATPPQRALLALPDVPQSYFEENRREVHGRMEALAVAMTAAGFETAVPGGGFYLWIDVGDRLEGATTVEWCERLASERGVGFWPGEDFGVPGFVRLALPQGDDWRDSVKEIEGRLAAAVG